MLNRPILEILLIQIAIRIQQTLVYLLQMTHIKNEFNDQASFLKENLLKFSKVIFYCKIIVLISIVKILMFSDLPKVKLRSFFKMVKKYLSYIIELSWLYAELHMIKIILLCVMFFAVYEVSMFINNILILKNYLLILNLFFNKVCLVHFVLVILVTISLVFNSRIQSIIVYIISVYVSILLLTKMIYQIEYIRESTWNVTCPVSKMIF